jgi:hypothetical protein
MKTKVAPHLDHELVQASLALGMTMLDPNWQRGDPPFVRGAIPSHRTRVVPGKLSWYQVWNRRHWIAFFSMAIGVLNYPELDWRFVSGGLHTAPVGYEPDGSPKVVVDISLFDSRTAQESIELARKPLDGAPTQEGWEEVLAAFVEAMLPRLRATASEKLLSPKKNVITYSNYDGGTNEQDVSA